MSELKDQEKAIKGHMEVMDKDFNAFLKVLLEKKPKPYLQLEASKLNEDMMTILNVINKVKYSALEMSYKISQMEKGDPTMKADVKAENQSTQSKQVVKNNEEACGCSDGKKTNNANKANNMCVDKDKENAAKEAEKLEEKDVKPEDAADKVNENAAKAEKLEKKDVKPKDTAEASGDCERAAMIVKLYDLNELHKNARVRLAQQIHQKISMGMKLKFGFFEMGFWHNFVAFANSVLLRLNID